MELSLTDFEKIKELDGKNALFEMSSFLFTKKGEYRVNLKEYRSDLKSIRKLQKEFRNQRPTENNCGVK